MTAAVWFPQNVIDALVPFLKAIDGVEQVVERDTLPADGDGTLGIMAVDWEPLEHEMVGNLSTDPVVSQHNYFVRYLVKATDEEVGRRAVNDVSRTLRLMLASGRELRVALAALTHNDSLNERIERIQKWGVGRQRLDSANIDGKYIAASGTDFYVQTETIQAF